MKVAAIVPAAGAGKRFKKKTAKPFYKVFGKPLIIYTLENLKKAFPFNELIVVVAPSWVKKAQALLKNEGFGSAHVVAGGKTRAESVWRGLKATPTECDFVLIHDAARPLVTPEKVRQVISRAKVCGAAILALPVSSTVKKASKDKRWITQTKDRNFLFLAQTPQVFRKSLLMNRYSELRGKSKVLTDEASFFDGSKQSVALVPGAAKNVKITTQEDLQLFKFYLKNKVFGNE